MNTSDYIESGVLELYAAGLLSVEEMRDVELNACLNPQVKTELDALQASFEKFAMKHAMIPPVSVKEKIMREIDGGKVRELNLPQTTTREISSQPTSSSRYLVAASIGLLLVATVFAVRFSSQVTEYQKQVAQLTSEQAAAQNEIALTRQDLSSSQQQIAMLMDANTIRISMGGTALSPNSLAMIYWNRESKSVYLDIKSLPENASDKQYQLWFIDPSNKPVSAGVFDAKTGILIKMIDAPAAVAFAVTLEPRGGSVNPTMDQMYVLGKVNS